MRRRYPAKSMAAGAKQASAEQERMLDAARGGDESAFAALVEPHRGELIAHCYRMIGSLHDAEDVLQETMLRAWRGIGRFEGRSSLRSWLYTIATNTCAECDREARSRASIRSTTARVPIPHAGVPGMPVAESVWIEPFPDEKLIVDDGPMAPEARYEAREAVELAFIAALQHLPPNQRAALILREVLGYSARRPRRRSRRRVASVNSALQRARATLESRLPERSQQATLRLLGDDGVREVVEAYVDAWDREDIDGVVDMLTEQATFSMPPIVSWFGGPGGHADLRGFLEQGPLTGDWAGSTSVTSSNGQYALAFYCWYEPDRTHRPVRAQRPQLRGPQDQRRHLLHQPLDRKRRPRGLRPLPRAAARRAPHRGLLPPLRAAGPDRLTAA